MEKYAGTRLTRLPTTSKVVALTFDAGANADGVPSILRTLQATGTPATFFLTGKWVQTYPQLAQQIGRSYQVGNHTYSHPHLPQLPDAAVRNEIAVAGTLIAGATGRDPRPLFRFPYGDGDPRTIAIANQLGYSCIQWTVDTQGWKGISGGQSVDSVVNRVLANLQPGEIVLMHVGSAGDHSTLDADALPRIIATLKAQGYSFTTVSESL
jgi:peptidoglycan/xylan/chitin deacetylase (PgdA/CDA1 family)